MSELIIISEEAKRAADFLQPMDSRFGRDYVEQTIQFAINLVTADRNKRIAELEKDMDCRKTVIEGYGDHVLKHDQRLADARRLIEQIGTTGVERTDIIQAAQKWMEGKP